MAAAGDVTSAADTHPVDPEDRGSLGHDGRGMSILAVRLHGITEENDRLAVHGEEALAAGKLLAAGAVQRLANDTGHQACCQSTPDALKVILPSFVIVIEPEPQASSICSAWTMRRLFWTSETTLPCMS